ncbi:hypothetical protein QVD17_00767 [Tagetes erecta]|uniref:Transcription repressor n=1 Tax=Tagetes erecta TaxID=13708 RepID=A0AAD8LAU7_TARER|nr:hypothetical protein QVD17_00767 [Tagetes erecta]
MPKLNKKLILNTTTVAVSCGCRKYKLSKLFHPKPNNHRHHHHSSTATSYTTTPSSTTTTTLSPEYSTPDDDCEMSRAVEGFGRIGDNSLAVEKDSDDPYVDFRESMLQMIMEKQIYSGDDLRELLKCFLQLNSPYYHGTIIRAFTEIWNNIFVVS